MSNIFFISVQKFQSVRYIKYIKVKKYFICIQVFLFIYQQVLQTTLNSTTDYKNNLLFICLFIMYKMNNNFEYLLPFSCNKYFKEK